MDPSELPTVALYCVPAWLESVRNKRLGGNQRRGNVQVRLTDQATEDVL